MGFSTNPNSADTVCADKYLEKNMPKEALNIYLKSIFNKKEGVKPYIGASRAYRELKEYKKAIKHLEKAKSMSSFDYEIYYELGLNHLLECDFEVAGANFRKTIKLNPEFTNAQIQLGIAHELMDEDDMAMKIYNKIIEEKPDYIPAHNHKAGLLMSVGQFEEAGRIFQNILKIDETYTRAYLGLGICLDKLKKHSFAVRFYKKYIADNPDTEASKSLASRIIDIYSITKNNKCRKLKIAK